jgi:hypothetical protein
VGILEAVIVKYICKMANSMFCCDGFPLSL